MKISAKQLEAYARARGIHAVIDRAHEWLEARDHALRKFKHPRKTWSYSIIKNCKVDPANRCFESLEEIKAEIDKLYNHNEFEMTMQAIKDINKRFRRMDESNLWPICGRFNATERAIRRLRDWQRSGGYFDTPACYEAALEAEISRIVNSI